MEHPTMTTVLREVRDGVGIATLNRPLARNALNRQLIAELVAVVRGFEADPAVGAIILTGGPDMFCAGADIKEMTEKTFAGAYLEDFVSRDWDAINACRKPVIAAVAGNALGGGCEFALMCDIVIADETARFGQPEVAVGTIPGGGGTQRLARSIGKAKAMELCLTGRIIDATEAERIGIVSLVVGRGEHLARAMEVGRRIGGFSRPIVLMIKESIQAAFETPLREGLHFERRMLHATFALDDQKEAMRAFAEKRKPVFRHG
jgi:enoyl-CoA hydratase